MDCHRLPGSEEQSVSQRFKDWGFASSSQKSKALLLPTCSLAAATVAAQNFKVADVLFEGPAPSWYRPTVARAGIKALKRGLPCGGVMFGVFGLSAEPAELCADSILPCFAAWSSLHPVGVQA
eukprot:s1049_g9.t1